MHYLFTVTFICPKGLAQSGHRAFTTGVASLRGLRGVRVMFSSLRPQRTDDPPEMDDLLERVKYSIGSGLWNQEPLLYNAFAVTEVDAVEGSLSEISEALSAHMSDVAIGEIPHNVTWVPLEDYGNHDPGVCLPAARNPIAE